MRILLVEPNEVIAQSIELALKAENFVTYATDTAEEAIDLGKLYDYDAILLELALPDQSGYDVIRALRTAKVPTPIIIVSTLNGVEDRVRAFGFGADDFIPKPFHKDELVARIHAVVRRSRGVHTNTITVGALTVDIGTKRATVAGDQVHLTGKEYGMLELLALRQGMTVTKEMFLNHLYGGMDEPELKIIDVFICKIRNKLRRHGVAELVQTVWGRGYTLEVARRIDGFVATSKPSELTSADAAPHAAKEAVAA